MATATNNASCIKCRKAKSTLKCTGCAQDFCSNHLNDHRQELNQQFDEIELNTDLFRQTLNEQTNNSFIQQINQWEKESINKIQQIANQCRHLIIEQTNKNIQKIEIDFNKLTNEIKEVRQENDFNEIDINEFNQKLKQLQKQLDQPSTISIQQDSTSSFIKEISVVILSGKSRGKKSHSVILSHSKQGVQYAYDLSR
jgi:chromosome segregation ATPase